MDFRKYVKKLVSHNFYHLETHTKIKISKKSIIHINEYLNTICNKIVKATLNLSHHNNISIRKIKLSLRNILIESLADCAVENATNMIMAFIMHNKKIFFSHRFIAKNLIEKHNINTYDNSSFFIAAILEYLCTELVVYALKRDQLRIKSRNIRKAISSLNH